jgi:hypothetical protein
MTTNSIQIFFIPCCSFAIAGTHHGTGQHSWEILPVTEIPKGLMVCTLFDPQNVPADNVPQFWWLCEPVYVLANMSIKGSIAVMLLRLTVDRMHHVIIWATLLVTELYSTYFFFLFVFQCRPSAYFWTRWTGSSGSCIDTNIVVRSTYGYSAVQCLTDWIFAVLPFFLVWRLQMTKRSKVSVALILSMGAIASTATIIRIPYLHTMGDVTDFLYATTDVAIWSGVETGVGITAACLATLRPLFRGWLANTRRTTNALTRQTSHRNRQISKPFPWAGGNVHQSRGYIRSHSAVGGRPFSPEHAARMEALGMRGIQKTTRVSVEAQYGPWAVDLEQQLDEDSGDRPSPKTSSSVGSKTRIHKCHLAGMMRPSREDVFFHSHDDKPGRS